MGEKPLFMTADVDGYAGQLGHVIFKHNSLLCGFKARKLSAHFVVVILLIRILGFH